MSRTPTIQPDLFGEHDARERRNQAYHAPATCPACGTTEPSGFLLSNNHGVDPVDLTIGRFRIGEHPIYGRQCVAQNLVTNHIVYFAAKDDADNLSRAVARGHELGLDVDLILDQTPRARREATS